MSGSTEFSGRTILVTGAGSGIGAATALMVAASGGRVGVLDCDATRCAALCDQITAGGGSAVPLVADVADEAQMRGAVATLRRVAGRIDGVVANAGVNGTWAPIDDLTPAEWDHTIAVNLRGTYLTLHCTVPQLKRTGGAIVIVASINGVRTFTTAGATAYAASKAAQMALGQQLALELALHRIRVNVVCPGYTASAIGREMVNRNTELAAYPASYPLGDLPLTGHTPADAEDVAQAICFLMSDRARHITGSPIFVDGGQSVLR
jgi:NAD(P)-dependent dehydrogenase (short-subunit alcohol dehydrogenase family)